MSEDQTSDDAPLRARRHDKADGLAQVGRSITINRPRAELYAFWRDFSNLPAFMPSVESIVASGANRSRWSINGPAGASIELETEIVEELENERIRWRSTEDSQLRTQGSIAFKDAPAGRGTVVTGEIAYDPPAGDLGRAVAKLLGAEPNIQARHELKRFKMLMETGEIATSQNRRD